MAKWRLLYEMDRGKPKPRYYQRWTAIGPLLTDDPEKAKTFDNQEDALLEPRHPLCPVELVKVDD